MTEPDTNALSSTTASSRSNRRKIVDPFGDLKPKNLTGNVRNQYNFIMKIDRLAADGKLMNDVPFCFKFDSNASVVTVLVQHDFESTWHNIITQCTGEGVHQWCGNCTHDLEHFSCCVPHTSTFTAISLPDISSRGMAMQSSSSVNIVMIIAPAAAVTGLAVVLLTALYCTCVSKRSFRNEHLLSYHQSPYYMGPNSTPNFGFDGYYADAYDGYYAA
uniref:Uncharacterized protein n=1 Tax=Eutreptiella gymnastica TaxID=73025 RepID=A0A7S1HS50_9EUGL